MSDVNKRFRHQNLYRFIAREDVTYHQLHYFSSIYEGKGMSFQDVALFQSPESLKQYTKNTIIILCDSRLLISRYYIDKKQHSQARSWVYASQYYSVKKVKDYIVLGCKIIVMTQYLPVVFLSLRDPSQCHKLFHDLVIQKQIQLIFFFIITLFYSFFIRYMSIRYCGSAWSGR